MNDCSTPTFTEAADQACKTAFDTAWLRLRLSVKSESPTEKQEALDAMREATKQLAFARLRKLYFDVAAYHQWISEIAGQSTQSFAFLKIRTSNDAANYVRRTISAVVVAIRPALVVSSCR